MNLKDDDKIEMNNSYKNQNIPLNYTENKKSIKCFIFAILILFCLIAFGLIAINSQKKNKYLKISLSKKSVDNEKDEINFFEKLETVLGKDEIFENEMMNKHTTYKLGGLAKFFIKPKSINKIIKVLQLCKEYSIDYFILGNGSNLLVSDKGFDGLIINIHEDNFSDLKVDKSDKKNYKVTVGGGMLMGTLAKKLCLLSLSGLEDIIDIPGTIGGGIIMNASAGLKKGIFNSLLKVKVITPNGEIKELSKDECQLGRRTSMLKEKKYMVIEATFKLIKENKIKIQKVMTAHTSKRYFKQPKYFPNAGCFFAWEKTKYGSLYEKYKENNLVSYRVGDAMIYTYNIAFIVNLGNASASHVYDIVTHVEKVIKDKYNIVIRREVVVLGQFS